MEQLQTFLETIIFQFQSYEFTVLNLIYVLAVVFGGFIGAFWFYRRISKRLYKEYNIDEKAQKVINRFARTLLYWITGILFVRSLGLPLPAILSYRIWQFGKKEIERNGEMITTYDHTFYVSMIVNSILIYVVARTLLWALLQVLERYYDRQNTDKGTRFAINQLIKYVVYTITLLSIIQALGFELTVIWGGAAALLVGFGLGVQQTFNDLVSGILIMVEGSVHVGDTVKVRDSVGTVTKIGIRASQVRLRDNVELIVPNSLIVMDVITNWNHTDNQARFSVKVGVAYGSNTQLVKKILLEVAKKHQKVLKQPEPFVRFTDFGSSSLDFEIFFWTNDIVNIEDTRSDLRFAIDQTFRENKVEIPFPQRDLWIRNKINFEQP